MIHQISEDIFHLKEIITPKICNWLITCVDEDWDLGPEPVDNMPLWQTKNYSPNNAPSFLYQFARKLSDEYLIHEICNLYQFNYNLLQEAEMWPFIRKYTPDGRDSFCLHPDPTYFSVTFLLCSNSEFEGGEFMICPKSLNKDTTLIPLDIGDCVVFRGPLNHGVQKITDGIRYSLSLFFWDPKERAKSIYNREQ